MKQDVEQDDVSLYLDIEAYLAALESAEEYVNDALLGWMSPLDLAVLSTDPVQPLPFVQLALATSELADENVCVVLSTSSDSEVLEAIVQNPRADQYALDNILSGPYGSFFALDVLVHDNCTPELGTRALELAHRGELS